MNRPSLHTGVLLLFSAVLVGCGESVSVPPANPSSVLIPEEGNQENSASVPTIALVLAEDADLESAFWEQIFRIEASRRNVLAAIIRSPAGKQAEAVRDLPSRQVSVAVVAPDLKDPDLPAALQSLADQQLPVVLVANRLEAIDGISPAPPIVRYSSIDDDAQALVAAAVEDARKSGFPDDAEAVIVTNGPFDEAGNQRLAALEKALAATSLQPLPTVKFQGYMEAARAALGPVLSEHPNLSIVLAEETQGATAACSLRGSLARTQKDRTPFILSCFGHSPEILRASESNQFAAFAQRDPERLARAAFDVATSIARGQSSPPVTEVKTIFTRSTSPADVALFEMLSAPAPGTDQVDQDGNPIPPEDPRRRRRPPP